MCSPLMHTFMNTQKCITCINILIPKPFLTHFWPNYWLFSFKCPYNYTLDIFSCLFNTCTRKWSKLVIKTTTGENSYHSCSWHQWPFGVLGFQFQKFITKSKLIQSITYKKHQIDWHLKYFQNLTSKKNSQKIDFFFCVFDQKKSFMWHS
jgi:hypothetical protein